MWIECCLYLNKKTHLSLSLLTGRFHFSSVWLTEMSCFRSSIVVGERWYLYQSHLHQSQSNYSSTNLTTTTTSVWRRSKCSGQQSNLLSSASSFINPNLIISFRRRMRGKVIQASNLKASSSNSNAKIANLSARRKQRVTLPNSSDESWQMYPISEFLSHPSGVETILNKKALQRFEPLDSNTYRCTLHSIQLLNFEVAPVLNLRVTPTSKDCTVEMLSCEFEGPPAVKRHNDRFSAFMRNHITWDANCSEPRLDVDVNLNMSLEIYTLPFTMLPISAVETPGNLIMQALVDKLVPLLIEQILQNYEKWVQEQCEVSL